MGGSKSARGGPNPLADMDRGGPNPLADLDRGVQIRGGSKSAVTPVPEKTISANRGLNPANRGIKFVLRLDCVPQNTISAIPSIR